MHNAHVGLVLPLCIAFEDRDLTLWEQVVKEALSGHTRFHAPIQSDSERSHVSFNIEQPGVNLGSVALQALHPSFWPFSGFSAPK